VAEEEVAGPGWGGGDHGHVNRWWHGALARPYRAVVGVQTCAPVVDARGRGRRRKGASEEEDRSWDIFLHI
jgi:hypothetical protein